MNNTNPIRPCDPSEMVLPPADAVRIRTAGIDVQADGLLIGAYRNSPTGARRIPPSYQSATWRNVLPVDDNFLEIGVGFDIVVGPTVRLRLDLLSAWNAADSILNYLRDHDARTQSHSSSGMPSSEALIPEDAARQLDSDIAKRMVTPAGAWIATKQEQEAAAMAHADGLRGAAFIKAIRAGFSVRPRPSLPQSQLPPMLKQRSRKLQARLASLRDRQRRPRLPHW